MENYQYMKQLVHIPWEGCVIDGQITYSVEKNVEFVKRKKYRKNFPEDYLCNIVYADMQNRMPACSCITDWGFEIWVIMIRGGG